MQAGELELLGAGKERGHGAQTPTGPSSWLFKHGLAGLGECLGARLLSLSTSMIWERGWEEPRILRSHHIIHSLPRPLVGDARHCARMGCRDIMWSMTRSPRLWSLWREDWAAGV